MPIATMKIEKCVQERQAISANSTNSMLLSKIFFQMEINGKLTPNLTVTISQPYGCNYSTEPVEVGPPEGYTGPFNHNEFSEQIERYYRSLVGSEGKNFFVVDDSLDDVVFSDNKLPRRPYEFTLQIGENTQSGW